ncbi:amino acid transporter [Nautilia profundicola AmH]|uniref:Amino acid transporter n=1 Tax=Nautilia profundicola (strain ATCC BAA-1463 / DSM 18972 / AmH) TaxID=598659 RepID=B9L805_NAUPA|nr:APC family permease [Nautilia profundicola]ACM93311.1 amino acid transporter [Nautilia profundicola AmH]
MKAFNTFSAAMLGIGSMVGAGIFIVIGEAGSIAGNIVWLSFVLGGIAALLSGYSLAKLAIRFPSRGGIIEYITQEYKENIFSGGLSIMFYFAQIIALAAVAKSFGEYGARLFGYESKFIINTFAVGIVVVFTIINLIGASIVAKSENIIVILKLTILTTFTISALFFINPEYLSLKDMPPISNMFFAIGLTFFAYQGFSVITNTIEDMENPKKTMLKAMFLAISIVMVLYVLTSLAVLGNLPLDEVIKAKDYALAKAAEPVFGNLGFKIMAIAALISTASAINATLYSTAEISYTLAKKGELPKIYEYNIFNSNEGLIISALIIIPMILFFNLSEITTVAALSVLIIQGFVHLGHLFIIKKTDANKTFVFLAMFSMFGITALTLIYNYMTDKNIIYYLFLAFVICFILEILLRLISKRTIKKQIKNITSEFIK